MSAPRQDFLLNANGDFPFQDTYIGGKIQPTPYGLSDNQHKLDIIVNNIGALKAYPLLGFGVFQYEDAEVNLDNIYASLQEQMKMDLYKTTSKCLKSDGSGGFEIDTEFIYPNY